jgi:hypothetical protein
VRVWAARITVSACNRCPAATKSQTDVTVGDIALEKEHFKYHRHVEVAQVLHQHALQR